MAQTNITIGGKEYPCRITMGAMLRFKDETGKDVGELDQMGFEGLGKFIYCCVKSASSFDGVAFDMDFERFADGIDAASVNSFYKEMGDAQKKA